MSLNVKQGVPKKFYESAGFQVIGGRAVRLDRLERLAGAARRLAKAGPFPATNDLMALVACNGRTFARILEMLGYRSEQQGGHTVFTKQGIRRRRGKAVRRRAKVDPDSPFAELASTKRPRQRA